MKQGQATHSGSGSTKIEPRSNAVSPAGVARIGNMIGNHADCGTIQAKQIPIYEGRGLEAPMVGVTTHKAGSQGGH